MIQIPPHYVKDEHGNWSHPSRLVGELLPTKPKQDPLPTLDQKPKSRKRCAYRVALLITLIRVGKAKLDDDNLASSFKGLRDAVAKSIGVDDANPRLKWIYGQVETRGRVGSIVTIERV